MKSNYDVLGKAFGFLRFFFENEVRQAFSGFFDEFSGKVGSAEI